MEAKFSNDESQGSRDVHVVQVSNLQGSGDEAGSETRAEPLVEPVTEIEKIWLIRHEGREFPRVGSWELVKFAEEFYREEADLSATRAHVASKNLVASTNQLYQLIGLYAVFQGVLLSACVPSNRLTCSHLKFPFTLCVIATVCTCFGIINTFMQIQRFWIQKFDFEDQNRIRESQLTELIEARNSYNFKRIWSSRPAPSVTKFWKVLQGGLVVTAVLGYAATYSVFIQRVLCP